MTLTIEIEDNKAAVLAMQAKANGMNLEEWLLTLARQAPDFPSIAHLQVTDPEEWGRQFHLWAESHDRTTPLLSEDVISRESIYPDRF